MVFILKATNLSFYIYKDFTNLKLRLKDLVPKVSEVLSIDKYIDATSYSHHQI